MTENAEMYLSTAELAARWSMTASTLRNWRFAGRGPRYFKPSGSRGKALYKIDDVLAWEKEHTVGGAVE